MADVSSVIRDALQPLVAHDRAAGAKIEQLEAELAAARAEKKQIEKLLRDGGLIDEPAKRTNGKRPKSASSSWVSETMIEQVDGWIGDDETPVTIREAAEGANCSPAAAHKALLALQERGRLRFLGKRPVEDARPGTTAQTWARS